MKFVCNNCGFTADIPEKMSACPMCGSSNVSSAAEISKFSADAEENEDENAKAQNFKAAAGPTQRVTLTEGLNGEKSSGKPAERSEKKTREIHRGSKLPLVIVLLLCIAAGAAAAAYFFFLR